MLRDGVVLDGGQCRVAVDPLRAGAAPHATVATEPRGSVGAERDPVLVRVDLAAAARDLGPGRAAVEGLDDAGGRVDRRDPAAIQVVGVGGIDADGEVVPALGQWEVRRAGKPGPCRATVRRPVHAQQTGGGGGVHECGVEHLRIRSRYRQHDSGEARGGEPSRQRGECRAAVD